MTDQIAQDPAKALRRYQRIWNRVKRFNDIKHLQNPKRRQLWQRARDAWFDYLKACEVSQG